MAEPPAQAERGLHEAARAVLRPAWRRVLADATGFAAASADERHRTRKRLKRFRYALESLHALYPGRPLRRLGRACTEALAALGRLNDLQLAQQTCRRQAEHDPRAWFAVGWLAAQEAQALVHAARLAARIGRPRRASGGAFRAPASRPAS